MIKINLDFVAGAVVGYGAGFFSRELMPTAAQGVKPLTKSTIKAGMMAYERAAEGLARLGETFEDLVAEAKEELATKPEEPTRKNGENVVAVENVAVPEQSAAAGARVEVA